MEFLVSWVKQIFVCSILTNVFVQLMPSKKYSKYMSYLCGLLMILVCMQPLITLFGQKVSFDSIYELVLGTTQMDSLKRELSYKQNDSYELVMQNYKKELAKKSEEIALQKGYYPSKTELDIQQNTESADYGKISRIKMWVTKEKKQEEQIIIDKIAFEDEKKLKEGGADELREELSKEFGIDTSCIEVYLNR